MPRKPKEAPGVASNSRRKASANSKRSLVPVSTPTALVSPSERAAAQRIFDSIPRDDMIAALLDDGSDKAVKLAERLADRDFSRQSFALQCAAIGWSVKDAWGVLIASRKTEAAVRIANRLGEVVEAMITESLPQPIACTRCVSGIEPKRKPDDPDVTCRACGGTSTILQPPDNDVRKMVLEMAGMLNQKVPLIAQQFNRFDHPSGAVGVPDMADWSRSSDDVFEERRGGGTLRNSVEEAEVVE